MNVMNYHLIMKLVNKLIFYKLYFYRILNMELILFLILIAKTLTQSSSPNIYLVSLTGSKTVPSQYINAIPVFNVGAGIKNVVNLNEIGVNKTSKKVLI